MAREGRHSRRFLWLVAASWLAVMLVCTPPASADESNGITMTAQIDGRDLAAAGANRPVTLGHQRESTLSVEVDNRSGEDLAVRRVRLEGIALGLTFVAYDTVVPLVAPDGEVTSIVVDLPLDDLGKQAVGLIPAAVVIFDDDGNRVVTERFTVDVEGSMRSTFGTFGLLVAAFTVISAAMNVWLVYRRRLPNSRVLRGVRFAVPGVGLGLTVMFTLTAARILPPYPEVWPLLVAVPGLAGFLLGYISPGPLSLSEDEIDVALREYRDQLAVAEA